METLNELKQYANERIKIRLNSFGYVNARITKMRSKQLKGYIKQYENHPLLKETDDYPKVKKEVEFREICLPLRKMFYIEIK